MNQLKFLLLIAMLLIPSAQAQEVVDESGVQIVAHLAMQTAKSRNFGELAENLFLHPEEQKAVLKELKKMGILKRSFSDITVEGSQVIIKERKKTWILDFEAIRRLEVRFMGDLIQFSGEESFVQVYQKLMYLQKKRKSVGWKLLLPDAEAELVNIAVATFTHYSLAAIKKHKPTPLVVPPKVQKRNAPSIEKPASVTSR